MHCSGTTIPTITDQRYRSGNKHSQPAVDARYGGYNILEQKDMARNPMNIHAHAVRQTDFHLRITVPAKVRVEGHE